MARRRRCLLFFFFFFFSFSFGHLDFGARVRLARRPLEQVAALFALRAIQVAPARFSRVNLELGRHRREIHFSLSASFRPALGQLQPPAAQMAPPPLLIESSHSLAGLFVASLARSLASLLANKRANLAGRRGSQASIKWLGFANLGSDASASQVRASARKLSNGLAGASGRRDLRAPRRRTT